MNPVARYAQMIRDRQLAIARDRFVAELAWQYRDQPGDAAWNYTELLKSPSPLPAPPPEG